MTIKSNKYCYFSYWYFNKEFWHLLKYNMYFELYSVQLNVESVDHLPDLLYKDENKCTAFFIEKFLLWKKYIYYYVSLII